MRAPVVFHGRSKATKTPLKKTIRPKTDQKAETDMSALDQAEIECQHSVVGDGITHQDNDATDGISGGKERYEDEGWQTFLIFRQNKALAKAGTKLPTTEEDYDFMSPASKSLSLTTTQRKPQNCKLPPLLKDDFKIIVRPFQGLPTQELTAPQTAEAVVNACQGTISGSQFVLRPKPGSNIFIISAPNKDVADIS
ncbi:hypothetical protein HPB51_019122 [Rhipicephalus microplus]|uniref:Uncharacterized protein n=1 Tax=Rhipicephalus microplus TaxID=6941 RepID=A0A9J6DWK9_RHIMP|nr:hypothetical protein HPB51_019122 [Rhipicephalus microplus]